jgi:hypothetical protein
VGIGTGMMHMSLLVVTVGLIIRLAMLLLAQLENVAYSMGAVDDLQPVIGLFLR